MDASKKFNLFALAGSHAVNSFYMVLLIPILPLIVKEFDLNYVEAGLVVTTYSVANSVFQFPLSFLSDYTGRWRTALTLALLVQALPVIFYGYAPTYALLLLFAFVSGMGSSAYHPPAVSLVTRELPDRRGFCISLFNGGGELGNMLSPAIIGWLVVYLASWRAAMHVLVLPGVLWAALIWLRFRDVVPERQSIGHAARATWRALILNRPFMLLVALSSLRTTGYRGLMAFLPLLLAEVFGFGVERVGGMLSLYYVLGVSMTVVIGRWSDGRSRTRIITVLTFLCAAALVGLSMAGSLAALTVAVAAVGSLLTPVPSLVIAVGTELVDERLRSSSVGFIYGVNEGASALSPIIGGLVAESFGLQLSFLFYALLFLLGGCVSIALHRAAACASPLPAGGAA